MRHKVVKPPVREIIQPLGQVCAHLAPQLSNIQSAWHKMVIRFAPCNKHAAVLTGLHLARRMKEYADVPTDAYRKFAEEQGQELYRLNVPAECVGVAILLYVECCLPHLASEDPRVVRWLRALLSWSRVYQFFLLAGYSRQAASDTKTLASRVNAAERRYQEASVKLGDAYEEERRRLARDLHDEIGHDLIVLKLYTQIISLDLKKGDLPQVRNKLKESVSLVKHVLGGVRNLVFDLGPTVWNEQGFVPAVRLHTRQFAARTGLQVRLDTRRLRTDLPGRYESALYRVLQGALANVAAHAGARHVRVNLFTLRDSFVMEIEDDGKGFNLENRMRSVAKSYGLRAMRDRIELLGGKIDFTSCRVPSGTLSRGTKIRCSLPLIKPEEE